MVVASAIASLEAYGATKGATQGQLAEIAIESGASSSLFPLVAFLLSKPFFQNI
jgi:hypothetical protein